MLTESQYLVNDRIGDTTEQIDFNRLIQRSFVMLALSIFYPQAGNKIFILPSLYL